MSCKNTTRVLAALLALLSLLALVACGETGGEAGGGNDTNHTTPSAWTVTYVPDNGTPNFTATVQDGNTTVEPAEPEKDGFRFLYWTLDGAEGAFDFTTPVHGNLTLTAVWEEDVPEPGTVRIRWEADDSAQFVFDGVTPRQVKVGETVRFRLRISPYYVGEATVRCGSVTATYDGTYYSFVATEPATVTVEGLVRDQTPIRGLGSQKSPYVITTASQLKTFTDSINAGEDKYRDAYVRLGADLDLGGIALSPIGGQTTYFEGEFDGDGHTISNFQLTSESGVIGFFGYIAEATVKNLNLVTDLSVEAGNETLNYIIGPVVAYAISGDIQNCTYRGTLQVRGSLSPDAQNVMYVGGICGFLQGYGSDYTGSIEYCAVSGSLISDGEFPLTGIGGIAGMLLGTSDSASAYVHNSVFRGSIRGNSAASGGIVGYLRKNSSVANCYTEGTVEARNQTDTAAAGAIVGLAENETAVVGCASSATLNSVGKEPVGLDVGELIGIRYADAFNGVDSRRTLLDNNHYDKNVIPTLSSLIERLGWFAADWREGDDGLMPDVNGMGAAHFTVRFDFGTDITRPDPDGNNLTQRADPVESNGYAPIWWVYGGSGMNNFKADDGTISYGYFLDEARTQRIPSSYLLTRDMTVYVGFADYSGVAGEYYAVITDKTASDNTQYEVKLTFDDNGKMTMYVDGMLANYVYVWDGTHLLIRDGYFAYLAYSSFSRTYDLDLDFRAETTDTGLVIYDASLFTKEDNTAIVATKKTAAFGEWFSGDGRAWQFYADGTGSITGEGAARSAFAYTCTGNTVRIRIGTGEVVATVSADGQSMQSTDLTVSLTRYDAFVGTWESAFNQKRDLVINGRGSLTLDGSVWAYTISGDTLTFGTSRLTYNDAGLLVLTEGNKTTVFGREGSYIGIWVETALNYQMRLDGIGRDGYGYGTDSNGVTFTYVAIPDTDNNGNRIMMVNLYYRTQMYGYFTLAESDKQPGTELLYAAIFTASSGFIVDDYNMCYYDPMYGTYHTGDGTTYDFNGLGAYHIEYHSPNIDWIAIGEVTITRGAESVTVTYTYNRRTGVAAFTHDGVSYTVTADGGVIRLNGISGYEPDGLEQQDLRALDGSFTLSFNGKSAAGLGEATLTFADGTTVTLTYTLETGASVQTIRLYRDGTAAYVLTVGDNRILWTPAGGSSVTEVGIGHVLLGQRYLAANGVEIVIGDTLDAQGLGYGTFGGTRVELIWVDRTYLAVYLDGEFLYYIGYLGDGTAVLMDGTNEVVGVICRPDGIGGVYTAANGNTLTLDGRSLAGQYVYPMAELTVIQEDGEELTEVLTYHKDGDSYYLYEIDRSGEEDQLIARYRLCDAQQDGAVAYTAENGTTIWLVAVDA